MRSVLALWCVAASRFWTLSPSGQPILVEQAEQPVAYLPRADVPVVVTDGVGFLAVDPRRSAFRAPLAAVVMQGAPPPPPKRQGATVDQDGKSNVWAVEPAMEVDRRSDKGILKFLPVAAVAVLALVSIPLLPLLFAANPDQA